MKKVLIVAAAAEALVKRNFQQLQEQLTDCEFTLLATQVYSVDGVIDYHHPGTDMYMPDDIYDIQEFQQVIIVQANHSVVAYLNVYKFLLNNGCVTAQLKVDNDELLQVNLQELAVFNLSETDSNQILWVKPEEINNIAHFPQSHLGKVVDGDWDLQSKTFADSISFYSSLQKRILENYSWQDTWYYRDVVASLENGEARFGCHTLTDFEQRLDSIEQLYEEIQHQGWQQKEDSDFVTINIGRSGQLLFNDGRHRLSIAKLLKLEKIPVKVVVRHTKWQDFKGQIAQYAKEHASGHVYTHIQHPDLTEFNSVNDDPRFELIQQHIQSTSKSLLDIGSHWGYFCQRFESLGMACTAVEADIKNFYFLEKLKQVNSGKFASVRQSIFDYVTPGTHFDVVLALNIFHHFLKTESLYQAMVNLLENLSMEEMFLQTHATDEPQMQGAYKNFSGDEFADFITEHSVLNQWSKLVTYDNGRQIYHLTK